MILRTLYAVSTPLPSFLFYYAQLLGQKQITSFDTRELMLLKNGITFSKDSDGNLMLQNLNLQTEYVFPFKEKDSLNISLKKMGLNPLQSCFEIFLENNNFLELVHNERTTYRQDSWLIFHDKVKGFGEFIGFECPISVREEEVFLKRRIRKMLPDSITPKEISLYSYLELLSKTSLFPEESHTQIAEPSTFNQ